MSLLIPYSDSALPMEAVPAIKLTHFVGEGLGGNVYAYARVYSHLGALMCDLLRFEQRPCEHVRMGLALGNADIPDKLLFYSVRFGHSATLCVYEGGALTSTLTAPTPIFGSGYDEQGLYVSACATIPAEVLREVFQKSLELKSVWGINIYSFDTRYPAFGSAFETSLAKGIYSFDSLSTFMPV